jgi:hypothetical protein
VTIVVLAAISGLDGLAREQATAVTATKTAAGHAALTKPNSITIASRSASGADRGTVRGLQARGALFWQCGVAFGNVTAQLARAFNRPVPDVRAELVAGLNPGVVIVPAHAMALGLVQERGFTYEKP